MRIMLVTDQFLPMVTGVSIATHRLAVDFAQRGHHVSVFAPSPSLRTNFQLEDNVHVYRFASVEWPFYEEQRIIKEINPDVLHVHSPLVLGKISQHIAHKFQKPVIATNHFMPGNMSLTLASNKQYNQGVYAYLMWYYNKCSHVTAPTMTALKLLHIHGLIAPSSSISNGINLQSNTPGQRDPRIRHRFHLPLDRPLALHVSRLSDEKRIDVLLDAATRMQSNGHIAIVGRGPAQKALHNQAQQLHLSNRVSFLGYVSDEDLLALRRAADLHVIPSEAELQSLSTMEAMACGLPVLAAAAYALPELVYHEKNGLLFQPGNSEELTHCLDIMLNNPDLRTRMGAESLKIIAQHDRQKVLDQWEDLYSRLLMQRKNFE